MRGPQQMIDVDERRLGERAQRLALDHQHVAAHDLLDPHAALAAPIDLAVGRGVLAEREQRRVLVGRDGVGREGGVHGIVTFFARRPILAYKLQRLYFAWHSAMYPLA